ncbi:MAG TPA: FecR family protein [Mucilaginibacter sp.]|jgi:transmembrane sensor|nr:FecR family protein [Mucilaginibacter sp.]
MNKPISVELLEKYINGKCTAEENALVQEWYFSFEKEHDLISDMSASDQEDLEEHIYNHILHNISALGSNTQDAPATKPKYRILKTWYAAAGVAAALLIFIGVLYNNHPHVKNLQSATANTADLVAVTNKTRQIYKLKLPDNSMVWLSPGARLTCPKTFGPRFRAVSMSGECFFEVTKNHSKPFIINSRSIVTKVWGTSFLVRDGILGNSADVSVVTGKVSVCINEKNKENADVLRPGEGEIMLYPHQKVTYLADQHILKTGNTVNEPSLQIWNRINLNFDNRPLREIIPQLNVKYHVHIKVVNEKLNHYVLNADLAGFNLPDVLQALKKSLNVDYELKNNIIELK